MRVCSTLHFIKGNLLTNWCPCTAAFEETFLEDVFMEARNSFVDFIKPDQPEWPRAVALLRPIAKHENLRHSILIDRVVDGFLQLLDHIIETPGEHFAHVMDALSCLVELRTLVRLCLILSALIDFRPKYDNKQARRNHYWDDQGG